MATAELRRSFRFHLEHGGWIVGRRAAGALKAARAELTLRAAVEAGRAAVRWEYDDEPYDPGDAATLEEAAARFESNEWTGPFGCVLEVEGEHVASLWGIVVGPRGTDDPYCRTVEAELALEALEQLRAPIGRRVRRGLMLAS